MKRSSPAYKAVKASKGNVLSLKEKNTLIKLMKNEGFKKVRGSTPNWTSFGSESMMVVVQIFKKEKSPSTYETVMTETKNHKEFLDTANDVSKNMIFETY